MDYHKPVLLAEVIAHLNINKGQKYIDATLGDGGHTLELLKRGVFVLGIDINKASLIKAKSHIAAEGLNANFTGVLGNFKYIDDIARNEGFGQVSGILYDLGYSSSELENPDIGLSFQKDQPLDMRMDETLGVTAADLVNTLPEQQLAQIIYRYSDERLAKRFAKAIINYRNLKRIQTTAELAQILADEAPSGYEHGRINPATRTFQALRIAVNDEIANLENSLPRAARLLLSGGRLVVVSFHSLEDKTVKQFGRSAQPSLMPVTKKPVVAGSGEVMLNPRARSAKMRVFEKQ